MSDAYRELLGCGNGVVVDTAMKCEGMFATHRHAMVSVSGGGGLRRND